MFLPLNDGMTLVVVLVEVNGDDSCEKLMTFCCDCCECDECDVDGGANASSNGGGISLSSSYSSSMVSCNSTSLNGAVDAVVLLLR